MSCTGITTKQTLLTVAGVYIGLDSSSAGGIVIYIYAQVKISISHQLALITKEGCYIVVILSHGMLHNQRQQE